MQGRLTSAQFTEIAAYLRYIDRQGIETWRASMLAATIANASGRYQRKMKPEHFFPPKPRAAPQLSEKQKRAVKRIERRRAGGK